MEFRAILKGITYTTLYNASPDIHQMTAWYQQMKCLWDENMREHFVHSQVDLTAIVLSIVFFCFK